MVATSVSVTALHSLLQCHLTDCRPLLPACLELPISLETTHLSFVINWKYTGSLNMLQDCLTMPEPCGGSGKLK